MPERLVEYLLVAGARPEPGQQQHPSEERERSAAGQLSPSPEDEEGELPLHSPSPSSSTPSQEPPRDVKVRGAVLQRFPAANWKESALPVGIEMFCRPLGWFLTYQPAPPTFISFVLTSEFGSRLFCVSLNLHQLHSSWSNEKPKRLKTMKDEVVVPSPRSVRREALKRWKTSPSFDQLDEAHEALWSPQDILVGSSPIPLEVFEPLSLCVVSRFPLFETLQSCLKALYVTWITRTNANDLTLMIPELLVHTAIPPINCLPVKKPFGALKELVLYPVSEESSLPFTSTAAIKLLRAVGVHSLIQLVATLLSDVSVLFISSSHTAMTDAVQALCAIIYPLKISHSIVPVVPAGLLECVQLPSTYLMGIHSSLRDQVDELGDVVEVYLDSGRVVIPDMIRLPVLPLAVRQPVSLALARILHPDFDTRDLVFGEKDFRTKSLATQDKEVRAVFLCMFMILLGDYQHFITVIRFHPAPSFFFNKEGFIVGHDGTDPQSLVYKMADSIAFTNFCHERSVPFRVCDFFDDLVARFISHPEKCTPAKLFASAHVQEVSEEILLLLPSSSTTDSAYSLEGLDHGNVTTPSIPFPTLNEAAINSAIARYRDKQGGGGSGEGGEEEEDEEEDRHLGMRKIPLLEATPQHKKKGSGYNKEMEILRNCLDTIFQSKIIEARKYIPSVTQSLKNGTLSIALVPELVHRLLEFGVLLSSDQFDLIVKLLNSALVDEQSAMAVLPLSTIIYREVNPRVLQFCCTCLQNHLVWSKLAFWRDALYLAIQAELVRVYAEVELAAHTGGGGGGGGGTGGNKDVETGSGVTGRGGEEEQDSCPDFTAPQSSDVGDITLRSRHRVRSSSPSRLRATLRATQRMIMSRSARIRMRASIVVPGVSEGVLPPNAEPVTSQEALHHLAKMLELWSTLSEERRMVLMRQEENAVMNQLILFVQRIINLRTPVEFPGGAEEKRALEEELEEFIGRLLRMVEVELSFDFSVHSKIRDQVHDMISIHVESLAGLRTELKRLPVSKPKVLRPPLISGEVMLLEGVPAYLLSDGRERSLLTPSYGHIFLTSYRVVFMGTPCDPHAANVLVTRSMPVASVFRLKKLPPLPLPLLGLTTVGGLQMRSTTAELIRVGFDEETSSMDMKNLLQHLVDLRHPTKITLGIRPARSSPPPPDQSLVSGGGGGGGGRRETPQLLVSRNKNKGRKGSSSNVLGSADTLTRVKLLSDISQSPCCLEYDRLGLGSPTFSVSKKGPWKVTSINISYALCASYPAALVVPELVSDSSLAAMASQFLHNRFPVVTWKHSKTGATLLRSSSFVPSSIARKTVSSGPLVAYIQTPARQVVPSAGGGASEVQNVGGVGVYNEEVEKYLQTVLSISQSERRERPADMLVRGVSAPPPTIEFEPEGKRATSKLAPGGAYHIPLATGDGGGADSESRHQLRSRTSSFGVLKKIGKSFVSNIRRSGKDTPEGGGDKPRKMPSKMYSSPQLGMKGVKGEDSTSVSSDHSGDVIREEDEDPDKVSQTSDKTANSSSPSPSTRRKLGHSRRRSSNQGREKQISDIDLTDIVMTEKAEASTPSPVRPFSPIDWEAVGNQAPEDPENSPELRKNHRRSSSMSETESDRAKRGEGIDERCSSPETRETSSGGKEEEEEEEEEERDEQGRLMSSVEPKKKNELSIEWEHFDQQNKEGRNREASIKSIPSPGDFSSLPTNPRDWIVVDALPEQLRAWKANALYIIGEKAAFTSIPDNLYPNCTFVPVDAPSDVGTSFKKLMRACTPSTLQGGESFMAAVEDSGWLTQLSTLMQLAGAVADLVDIQGSSVLVCLEEGWNATAQVVSLAQILLDPHYRTLEGFKMLVEKDWLSFGHKFSQKGNHTAASHIAEFSPVFLQFLDCVHQVCRQFPLSFEFNDFYLRTMAYHYSSMRFHTFTMDSEKERYASNWLRYRPRAASIYGNAGQMEDYVSYWEHIEALHRNSMLFYNFKYQPVDTQLQAALRPYSFQANLDVWCFYLDNWISQFPPFDTELISEGDLTLLDLHHNFFDKEKSFSLMALSADPVISEIGLLLGQYTALMNSHANKVMFDVVTWIELWEELQASCNSEPPSPLFPADRNVVTHGQTLHKRTTMAVLIKGKLAVELQDQFTTPHDFALCEVPSSHLECNFCKHLVLGKEEAVCCRRCGLLCHQHCHSRMPYNCGFKSFPLGKAPTRRIKPDGHHQQQTAAAAAADGSQRSRLGSSIILTPGRSDELHDSEGWLYKRGKIVRNWKQRWFILDVKKKEMSYSESNKVDEKSNGTISLGDILSVEEAEPQVVPALKPGEAGFFFNVVTQKRVYHLMALRETERIEWMRRLRAVVNSLTLRH